MGTLESALFERVGRFWLRRRESSINWASISLSPGTTVPSRRVPSPEALPLLQRADSVVIVTITGSTVLGPDGTRVQSWLARHGVRSEAKTIQPGSDGPGAALLAEASRLKSDLLIKGAYTNSRLRQMVFGGVTNHLLNEADLPVFMSV